MLNKKIINLLFLTMIPCTHASTCPDPANSGLSKGNIPKPWQYFPLSESEPSKLPSNFKKATIMVINYGRGVSCTYENSHGYYTIWWEGSVKIPSPLETLWRSDLAGYQCTDSVTSCIFYTDQRV